MTEVLRGRTKQVADEEFTNSVESVWLIWRVDESGWPLLFLEYLHWRSPLSASSSSSSAVLCGLGHLFLAEEF